MTDRSVDLYKALQVDPEADPEVIQAAYRRLAQKYHPDVAHGPDAVRRMVEINRAWDVLGDPERRQAYDRDRAPGVLPASPTRASTSPRATGAAGTGARGTGVTGQPAEPAHRPGAGTGAQAASQQAASADEVFGNWTSGRSATGFTYDPASMRRPEGQGAAGPPPGRPSGSVLNFGRYADWSLGEIGRVDLEYLEWLDRAPIGRPFRDEIDAILRSAGRRRSPASEAADRHGLFRRR